MTLARRLLYSARGGQGFTPPNFAVTGPYAQSDPHAVTVQTQLHCHTSASFDGSIAPATMVANYLSAGYGALALTDHDVVTSQPAGITTAITANEHSPSQQHIIALDSDWERGATTDAQAIIDGITGDGGQAHIAHPNWFTGMTYGEMAALTDYLGIEIHNGYTVSSVSGQSPITYPGYAIDRWDELLTGVRRDVWGLSVDDLHAVGAYTAYDVGRVQVFAATNTKDDIMAALVGGNFVADVANFGVTPGFPYRTPAGIAVTCPGAVRIEAWGADGLLTATNGNDHAHPFDGTEEYVRLVAIGDYTEPFSSALSDRWYQATGTWTVAGGTVSVSSDATARKLILRRHREGDFAAQVDMRLSAAGLDAGALLFNVLDDDHFYMIRIGESAVSGYDNELAVAYTTIGGFVDDSQLDNATFDPDAGTWYTVRMDYTASTGRIRGKVWETGQSEPDWMVDVTDTTWRHGAFGLRANRSVAFDNLYINGFQTFYQPVAVD